MYQMDPWSTSEIIAIYVVVAMLAVGALTILVILGAVAGVLISEAMPGLSRFMVGCVGAVTAPLAVILAFLLGITFAFDLETIVLCLVMGLWIMTEALGFLGRRRSMRAALHHENG